MSLSKPTKQFSKTPVGCIGRIRETEISHPAGRRSVRIKNKHDEKQWNAPWKIVRTFGDTGEGKLTDARGLAINQDGDIAVADHESSRINVYDKESGILKMSIDTKQSLHSNPSGFISAPHDVVLSEGHYIVTDQTYFPTVYDNKGRYIRQVVSNKKDDTFGIAVNSQGHVLVGHDSAETLEIHSYTDGKQITSIDIPIPARYIAVSQSDDYIVITSPGGGARVIDSHGHTVHVLRPPLDVTPDWCPSGVCTIGDHEEVFICNLMSTIGVYRFSLTTGKYLGCVTTEVIDPEGVAFKEDGRLVVADKTCVKVFAPAE